MLLKDASYVYPSDIPDFNEYLLESYSQLVDNITGLFQDHYMSPNTLDYFSTGSSSFPTYLSSDIPSQEPTLISTYTHRDSTSDLTSKLLSLFPSNMSSEKSIP